MRNANLFEIRPYRPSDLDAAPEAQQNYGACRLYERQGFIAVTHLIFEPIGIGDVVYRWPGH